MWECAKENRRCSFQGRGWISHIYNDAMRANIAFAVNTVSQFMTKVGPPHLDGHKTHYEVFQMHFGLQIMPRRQGFCHKRILGCGLSRRCIVFVGVGVTSWKCKKQPTIALSMTKAEYVATSHCTKEVVWLRQLLMDVGNMQEEPTSIMCDNHRCIALAKNLTHPSCTKHIDLRHHFIRKKLENQEICLKCCLTENIITEVLTKPLANDRYQALTKAMGLEALDYLQSGSVEGKANRNMMEEA